MVKKNSNERASKEKQEAKKDLNINSLNTPKNQKIKLQKKKSKENHQKRMNPWRIKISRLKKL